MSIAPLIATWLEHIRVLAVDIGPRGSTTAGERRGAEYCYQQFKRIGLEPVIESFRSAKSIFHPHLLGSLLMILAYAIYPLNGTLSAGLAVLISMIAIVSELLELSFRDNLFRWLVPKGQSQNVYAILPPANEHRQDLILVGHIDTQRTPLIFRTATWVEIYKKFTMVAFTLFVLQLVLYLLGFIFRWNWVWFASAPTAICAIVLAGICIQADSTPFTTGANDNASAVGMVLALAENFAARPLQHTRLFFVCTGCEEVQHYGMIDFLKRHRAELHHPRAIIFELLGCSGPGWLVQEGIVVPFRSDDFLRKLVERLNSEHPEWGAYPVSINGGNSELADCVRYKIPAITLFGLTHDGKAPYWHQIEDTFDKINPTVLERTWLLVQAVIAELDRLPVEAD